jgi:hypothetical protein
MREYSKRHIAWPAAELDMHAKLLNLLNPCCGLQGLEA